MTKSQLGLVSEVALKILERGRQFEEALGLSKISSHSTRSSKEDIYKMVEKIMESEVPSRKKQRKFEGWDFVNPRREGILKVEKGWLKAFLARKSIEEEAVDVKKHISDLDDVMLI